MRGITTGLLLCVAHFCSSQTGDTLVVAGEVGRQEVKFSNETKYSIVSMTTASKTKVLLTSSDQDIFLQSPEVLEECAAHWNSEAVVVEIHGFDHDYFTVIIEIYRTSFRAKFSWESDHIEDIVSITPLEASLKLSDDNFKKGKIIKGALKMTAACNGGPCNNARFNIEGNFMFTIP